MANKYLDLAGLQRLVNKIKALIPTRTSELDNDNGFITIEDIPGGETKITIRHQERFIVGASSVFEFTKGYYTLNANSVDWYLDGIKQSNDTLIEINNRTIEVVGGLPQGSTVVFDYVEYTNTVIGLPGQDGSDAEVTNANVISAIGYTPVSPNQVLTDVPSGAKFTDTITTINGKTGVILKDDIVALGILAQDITELRLGNFKFVFNDIENSLDFEVLA